MMELDQSQLGPSGQMLGAQIQGMAIAF